MKKTHYPCDLCGQAVKVPGFSFTHTKGPKKFCCEGCLRIFQLLEPEQPLNHQSTEKTS